MQAEIAFPIRCIFFVPGGNVTEESSHHHVGDGWPLFEQRRERPDDRMGVAAIRVVEGPCHHERCHPTHALRGLVVQASRQVFGHQDGTMHLERHGFLPQPRNRHDEPLFFGEYGRPQEGLSPICFERIKDTQLFSSREHACIKFELLKCQINCQPCLHNVANDVGFMIFLCVRFSRRAGPRC